MRVEYDSEKDLLIGWLDDNPGWPQPDLADVRVYEFSKVWETGLRRWEDQN